MEVTILKIAAYLKNILANDQQLLNTVLDGVIRKLLRDRMKYELKDKLINDIDLMDQVVEICKNSMPLADYNEIKAYINYLKGN